MCEKNLERKVLSPPSNDDISLSSNDDVEEEFIIDDEVKEKSIKPKKRSRRKKFQKKICNSCGQDILEMEKRDMFMHHDTYHRLRAKEYCEDHERTYSGHKCKPHWCVDCGYLVKYIVEIDHSKWDK